MKDHNYIYDNDDCEEMFEEESEQDDYELETKARWMSVRTRNLVINLAKTLIRLGVPEKRLFTREELINTYKFKLADFEQIVGSIFKCSEKGFYLNADTNEFINKVIASHNAVKPYVPSAEARFLRIYGRFYDDFSQNFMGHSSYKKYHSMFESIKEIIPVLHWGYLPIFGRYLLYNRESDPERDMLEFYDHIDCLNALLKEVKGEALQLDNNSDGSLNVDIKFNIYSRKRKVMEHGYIKRTIDGWYFKFSILEGKSNKDATGTLTTYLKQEEIFYPYEGISYAFKNLWDDVDDGDITYDEYVSRIDEIANWINKTDAVLDEQPEWLHYTCGQKYQINDELRCEAGDSTLNRDISFAVFSRRWGHEDHYIIRRTQDGWYCGFLAINGECQKSGEGALWNNLNHDSIFFSQEGIGFAMLKLWDEANRGILSFEMLSERLQQVADWISVIEKSVYAQPGWVYYY